MISGSCVEGIVVHDWKLRQAHFKIEWSSSDTTWGYLKDMREDYPRLTAQYILGNKISWSKRGSDQVL